MSLSPYVDTLNLLGDESRLRLCALLRERELCVTDLVRVTGMAQSRVSTHLGRLREAGFVRDRRNGTQCFYAPRRRRAAARLRRPCSTGRRRRPIRRWSATSGGCSSSTPNGAAALPDSGGRRSRALLLAGAHLAVARRGHRRLARARRRARRGLGRRGGRCDARAVLPVARRASIRTRA